MTGELSDSPNGRHAGKTMPVLAPGFTLPEPKDAWAALDPEQPDSELLGLCRRFERDLTDWDARVAAWECARGQDDQVRDELIRLQRRWKADLARIRSIEATTSEGLAARMRVA
jgi:hypothetical protein